MVSLSGRSAGLTTAWRFRLALSSFDCLFLLTARKYDSREIVRINLKDFAFFTLEAVKCFVCFDHIRLYRGL